MAKKGLKSGGHWKYNGGQGDDGANETRARLLSRSTLYRSRRLERLFVDTELFFFVRSQVTVFFGFM